jgi:ABC-type transport system substrate-binding protein
MNRHSARPLFRLLPLLAVALLARCGGGGGKIVVDHGEKNPIPEDRLVVDDSTVGGGPWTVGHYGGTIVYPTIGDPKSFNWVVSNDQNTSDVFRLIDADLTAVNKTTQRIEPELAKSYEVSPDSTSITVHLRHGVKWSDGEPFNAADVLFTWHAMFNPHVSSASLDALQVTDEVTGDYHFLYLEALDDYTVRVHSPIPFAILDRVWSEIWMMPRHEFRELGGFDPLRDMPSVEQAGFVISRKGLYAEGGQDDAQKKYWEVWFQPRLEQLGRIVPEGADQDPENQRKLAAFKLRVAAWDKKMDAWAAAFSSSWSTDVAVDAERARHRCSLGPFRLAKYIPGQYTFLVPNPYYYKYDVKNQRLPYVDRFVIWTVQNQDTMMVKFYSGEGDILNPVQPPDVAAIKELEKSGGVKVYRVGSRLADTHFFVNQHRAWRATVAVPNEKGESEDKIFYKYPDKPEIADKIYADFKFEVKNPQTLETVRANARWKPIVEPEKAKVFQSVWFRRALSAVTDREAVSGNIFNGLAEPLYTSLGPGYKDWYNPDAPKYPFDLKQAAEYLDKAGMMRRGPDGYRLDPDGKPFSFVINTNANNEQRVQIGTLLADNLQKVGINAVFQPLDFNTLIDKLESTFDFDCILLGLGGGDVEQAANGNVYRSGGFTHSWAPKQPVPMTEGEAQVDRIFNKVATSPALSDRVAAMHEIERINAEQQYDVHVFVQIYFVAGRSDIGNFKPALMENNAYWNGYMLYRGEKGPPAGGAPAPAVAPTPASASSAAAAASAASTGKPATKQMQVSR